MPHYNPAYYALLSMAQQLLALEMTDLGGTSLSSAGSSIDALWFICNTLRDPFNLGAFPALPQPPPPRTAPQLQGVVVSAGVTRVLDAVAREVGHPVTANDLQSAPTPAPTS